MLIRAVFYQLRRKFDKAFRVLSVSYRSATGQNHYCYSANPGPMILRASHVDRFAATDDNEGNHMIQFASLNVPERQSSSIGDP
ncbi:MAG: hypothetical protein DMG40_15030 [Acidobacteria bacterium]|nr:MAG: hypothetical protein DMG40_15030 [Acidobacteriota bacterium]